MRDTQKIKRLSFVVPAGLVFAELHARWDNKWGTFKQLNFLHLIVVPAGLSFPELHGLGTTNAGHSKKSCPVFVVPAGFALPELHARWNNKCRTFKKLHVPHVLFQQA